MDHTVRPATTGVVTVPTGSWPIHSTDRCVRRARRAARRPRPRRGHRPRARAASIRRRRPACSRPEPGGTLSQRRSAVRPARPRRPDRGAARPRDPSDRDQDCDGTRGTRRFRSRRRCRAWIRSSAPGLERTCRCTSPRTSRSSVIAAPEAHAKVRSRLRRKGADRRRLDPERSRGLAGRVPQQLSQDHRGTLTRR